MRRSLDGLAPRGDVLAAPARSRIFALLVERGGAADTSDLAAALGLHPNGVRRHLEQMADAGLLERRREQGKRGRPRDRWVIAPDAEPGGERPTAYADLANWLSQAVRDDPDAHREIEGLGRRIGHGLAPEGSANPVEAFQEVLTALGFQPRLEQGGGGDLVCRLGNCPYRDSARDNADVVCTLHRGITTGLLAELDPKAELKRFEPRDPHLAGCLVEVSGDGWAGSSGVEPPPGAPTRE